jgi:hypothetical protein
MPHSQHKPNSSGSLVELSNEEECALMDPETWNWDNADVVTDPIRVSVEFSVRLTTAKYAPIARRARELGIAAEELARRYLLDGAVRDAAHD